MDKNELTWQDIRHIVRIADTICNSLDYSQIKEMGEVGYYTAILKRFNKER